MVVRSQTDRQSTMIISPTVKTPDYGSTPETSFFRYIFNSYDFSHVWKDPEFELNWTQSRFESHIDSLLPLHIVKESPQDHALVLTMDGGSYTWKAASYRELIEEWVTWPRCPSDLVVTNFTTSQTTFYGFWEWGMAGGIREKSRTDALLVVFAKNLFPPKFCVVTDYLEAALSGKTVAEITQ